MLLALITKDEIPTWLLIVRLALLVSKLAGELQVSVGIGSSAQKSITIPPTLVVPAWPVLKLTEYLTKFWLLTADDMVIERVSKIPGVEAKVWPVSK